MNCLLWNCLHPQKMQGCSLLAEWGGSRDATGESFQDPQAASLQRVLGVWGARERVQTQPGSRTLSQQELQVGVSGHRQCQLLGCHFSVLCWQAPVVLMVARGQGALCSPIPQPVPGQTVPGAPCLSSTASLWRRAISPRGTDVAFTHREKRQ